MVGSLTCAAFPEEEEGGEGLQLFDGIGERTREQGREKRGTLFGLGCRMVEVTSDGKSTIGVGDD